MLAKLNKTERERGRKIIRKRMIAHMPETQEELLIKKKRRGRKKEREKDIKKSV